MSKAPRWRVRGGNPNEEQKEGWVLVGQGHSASNRRGLSSGSSLLAEKNGSEGGWILYFRAGREVKAIREDCHPGKEEEKKVLSSISTSFSRCWKSIPAQRIIEKNGSKGGWILYFQAGREVKAIREDCPPGKEEGKKVLSSISTSFPRTSFPSADSSFTQFSKQRRKGGQQIDPVPVLFWCMADRSLDETTPPLEINKRSKKEKRYPIGNALVELLDERNVIEMKIENEEGAKVMRKRSHYYNQKAIQVICKVDLEELPLKINLPMKQAFKINEEYLKYVKDNYQLLVNYNMLQPKFLYRINTKDIAEVLKKAFLNDPDIRKSVSFSFILTLLLTNIEQARYEKFILNMAESFRGYDFYMPTFIDFRGRIYRSGILHFHERDLARSLIIFSDPKYKKGDEIDKILVTASAFHFKSFKSIWEAQEWCNVILMPAVKKYVNPMIIRLLGNGLTLIFSMSLVLKILLMINQAN
nr:DNA-dependent RNA polymerase, mitochondrial [Tanacetum cinerariifolium]